MIFYYIVANIVGLWRQKLVISRNISEKNKKTKNKCLNIVQFYLKIVE